MPHTNTRTLACVPGFFSLLLRASSIHYSAFTARLPTYCFGCVNCSAATTCLPATTCPHPILQCATKQDETATPASGTRVPSGVYCLPCHVLRRKDYLQPSSPYDPKDGTLLQIYPLLQGERVTTSESEKVESTLPVTSRGLT